MAIIRVMDANQVCLACQQASTQLSNAGLFHLPASSIMYGDDGQPLPPGMSNEQDAKKKANIHKQRRDEQMRIKKSFGIGTACFMLYCVIMQICRTWIRDGT